MYVYHVGTRALFFYSFSLFLSLSLSLFQKRGKCLPADCSKYNPCPLLRFFASLPLALSLHFPNCVVWNTTRISLSFCSFSLSRFLQIDESIDSTRVWSWAPRKKGSLNSQPEGKRIETDIANERINRAGDDDDDGRHTKNTCLPTLKKRKKEKDAKVYTQIINLGNNLVSYLPEVSR